MSPLTDDPKDLGLSDAEVKAKVADTGYAKRIAYETQENLKNRAKFFHDPNLLRSTEGRELTVTPKPKSIGARIAEGAKK